MSDFTSDDAMRKGLREPFPPEQIGKLPATSKRPELDYVGHAAVTDRLNAVAPDATWTVDELFSVEGTVWIRGTMTIGGISRPEYGDGSDPKSAIGNFIRRGAMRFGVALDLWTREELETSPAPGTDAPPSGGKRGAGDAPPADPSPPLGEPAEAPGSGVDPAPGGTPSSGGQESVGMPDDPPPEDQPASRKRGRRWPKDPAECPHATSTVMGTDKVERCKDCGKAYAEYAA